MRRTITAAVALCIAGAALAEKPPRHPAAAQKPAAAKKAARPAKAVAKTAPKPAPEPPLPPADDAQRAAAALAYAGSYDCEFGQSVVVAPRSADAGYLDVTFGKERWAVRPVLSSTGVLRLEDVKGRMLMLQIANKSMVMDVEAGHRIVDDCVNERQRALHDAPQERLGIGAAVRVRLRLVETTDLRMHLLDWDYDRDRAAGEGLARAVPVIKAARAEAPNSLLFDGGDLLEGSPLGDWAAHALAPGQVHPAYKVLNRLDVAAAGLGGHDFDYGLPFLRQAVAGAAFPVVAANVVDAADPANDRSAFTPYVILERSVVDDAGGRQLLKVGVVGFAPPPALPTARLAARDIVESARRWVPEMKAKGADIVVALAHAALTADASSAAGLAEVPGIDAILFGHADDAFPGPAYAGRPRIDAALGTIDGVPAVAAGARGSAVGVVDLVLENANGGWKVKGGRAEVRPVIDRATGKPVADADPMVAETIGAEQAEALAEQRAEVARTSTPIRSYFAQVADDASVDLVAQAQLAWARAALKGTPWESLPLLSAAGPLGGRQGATQYADIRPGPIARRDLAALSAGADTVRIVAVTGAQLREWLEMAAGAFNRIDPAGPPVQDLLDPTFPGSDFDAIDGVGYRIDVTRPARYDHAGRLVAADAHRIVDLRRDGEPVADDARFLVVTNGRRRFPGLESSTVVVDSAVETRKVVADWLAAQKTVAPSADGNWRIEPVPGVALRFRSGAGGVAELAQHPGIGLVGADGDGSALYELKPQ